MSTSEFTVADQRPRDEAPDRCTQCGAVMAEDQEWCLQCGSAQTLIYSPPDWRFPVLVVAVVIVVALAGFFYALHRLSDDATRTASARAGSASTSGAAIRVPGSAAATTPTATQVHGIASWPVGVDGWTVVVERFTAESAAYGRAQQIVPSGIPVGVLNSSDHPSMKAGYWIVFSGRYPNRIGARAAAARLLSDGYTTAHARRVAPPGGL